MKSSGKSKINTLITRLREREDSKKMRHENMTSDTMKIQGPEETAVSDYVPAT